MDRPYPPVVAQRHLRWFQTMAAYLLQARQAITLQYHSWQRYKRWENLAAHLSHPNYQTNQTPDP